MINFRRRNVPTFLRLKFIIALPPTLKTDNFIVSQKRFKRTLVNTDHEQIEFDDSLEQAIMLQI